MDHKERAKELRNCEDRHYNCAQAVLMAFSDDVGLDKESGYRLTEHFGGGMRRGSVCGAVTGGLMTLGLLGGDSRLAAEFQRRFKERAGAMDCAELLKNAKENGEEKKPHCDRMVALAAELIEELLEEQ